MVGIIKFVEITLVEGSLIKLQMSDRDDRRIFPPTSITTLDVHFKNILAGVSQLAEKTEILKKIPYGYFELGLQFVLGRHVE